MYIYYKKLWKLYSIIINKKIRQTSKRNNLSKIKYKYATKTKEFI